MSDTVLVTGGTGFIGARVVEALQAAGAQVTVVARRSQPLAPGVRQIPCDLLDDGETRALIGDVRPHRLIHCAWSVEHGHFWHAAENSIWAEASAHLFSRFFEAGGRQATGIGTCAEYDWSEDSRQPWDETRPLHPASEYGLAKARACADLFAAADKVRGHAIWARLFFLFGPNEDSRRLIPTLRAQIEAGDPIMLDHPDAIRDFASTWFVGQIIARLSLTGQLAGPVNVGTGKGIRISDLAAIMAQILGRPLTETNVPMTRMATPASPSVIVADTRRLQAGVIPSSSNPLADLQTLLVKPASPNADRSS